MGRTLRRRKKRRKLKNTNGFGKVFNLQRALKLKCPNIQINYFNDTGWGMMCKKKIEKGEVLISLPLHYLITTEVSCDISSVLNFENQTPQFILSIFLLYESHLKEESKYYEYLETLPETFNNPYFCTKDEVNLLPEFIRKEVVSQIIFVDGIIEYLFKIVDNKTCPHCQKILKNIFTREKFVWAWFIVNTRSVYYEDKKNPKSMALAPFLDFFNHSNDAVIKMFIDFENKSYILKTFNNFKKFEQVFINYGNHSNVKLFLEYGFILPDNPNDFVEFSFEEVFQSAKEVDVSFGEITKAKYNFIMTNKLNQNLTKSSEFSWNFNGLIYVLITSDQNLSVLQSKTYSNLFTVNEKILIQKIAEVVSRKKCNELKKCLLKMNETENCTQSFQIAKDLVGNYINLLL